MRIKQIYFLDVVYDDSVIPALCSLLSCLLKSVKESRAFICCTIRNEKTIEKFCANLSKFLFITTGCTFKMSNKLIFMGLKISL